MNIDQEIAILVNLLKRVDPFDIYLENQLEQLLKIVQDVNCDKRLKAYKNEN